MSLLAQSRLYALAMIIMAVTLTFSYFNVMKSVKIERQHHQDFTAIVHGVFELNLLTAEILLLDSKSLQSQWHKRHASLTNLMLISAQNLSLDTKARSLLSRSRVNLSSIRRLFFKVIVAQKKSALVNNIRKDIIINKIAVQIRLASHKVVSDINHTVNLSRQSLQASEAIANTIIQAIIVSIFIALAGLIIWLQKSFITPILKLKEYSEILIKGNYRHNIHFKGNNEISQLATSFNSLAITIAEKIEHLTDKSTSLEKSKNELETALLHTRITEQQYKDIYFAAADSIITINDKGIIQTCNPATKTMFGYEKSELVGQNIKMLTSFEHTAKHDSYISNYITTAIAKIINIGRQVEGRRKDGTAIQVHLRISEIKHQGKLEFIGILRDISAEHKAKEIIKENTLLLENTNKELESYAYSISHDLRSPLRSIDGFSTILLEDYSDTLDSTAKGYLEKIRAGSTKMAMLINELLKMSRITKESLSIQDVDLSKIAQQEINILKNRHPNKNVHFKCQQPLMVHGDQTLLQAVIENLLNNALKYSQYKDPIEIEMGSTLQHGLTVFFIKDNGVGFDMKHKNKLFKAFQRLHKINLFEGSGIGLATVQRIISRHNGEIWAEAEIDKGATFFFTLRL